MCSSAEPLGVMPVAESVTRFGATSPAGAIASCGLMVAPVPDTAKSCDAPFAAIVSVAFLAPNALGLNCIVTRHAEDAASEPPSWHVVVNGNSAAFESAILVTGTAAVPLFDKVIDRDTVDVLPTPVVGNVRFGHVMTNVDGVTVDGVVAGELLEQLAASAANRRR